MWLTSVDYDHETGKIVLSFNDGTERSSWRIVNIKQEEPYVFCNNYIIFEKDMCLYPTLEVVEEAVRQNCQYLRARIFLPLRKGRTDRYLGYYQISTSTLQSNWTHRITSNIKNSSERQLRISLDEMDRSLNAQERSRS